ncbi:MAG: hypothetical protein WAU68_02895 [Vitreimonas sp.]
MTIGEGMSGAGRALLVLGLAGTGALCLIYAGLDPQWQHPPGSLNNATLAYANGALLIALSLALLLPKLRAIGGYALAAFLVLWVLTLAVPRIIAGEEAAWLAPAEVLTVAIGAWIASGDGRAMRPLEVLFGLCLITFGVAHFLYLDLTAHMIPSFIPFHLQLAAFTGAGHIAAALSVISGILAWLGSALLALMFSLFVLLLHVPRVLADPGSRLEWTMLFHATALTGAAWLIAGDIWKGRSITQTR